MPLGDCKSLKPPLIPELPQRPQAKNPEPIDWNTTLPRYRLCDIILDQPTKSQIKDVISVFQNQALLFSQWGLEEHFSGHRGLSVNLYGPPGTGKTMAAHAIAAELQLPMLFVDYAEIESKYVGETSKNLSALFACAKEKNAAIFFDEADALLSKRVTNMTSSTDVSVNQTRSVLLNLLNDYQGVILFATNFIQNFDAAFLRRIQYHIHFPLPNCEMRERLWRLYLPSKLPHSLDIAEISSQYEGVSGSDISRAILSAAISAARHGERTVPSVRFHTAISNVIAVKQANNQGEITVSTRRLNDIEAQKLEQGEAL